MTDSFEDLFLPSQDLDSPGGQLYLYRQLRLRSSRQTDNPAVPAFNYNTARKLAARMGIGTPEKLAAFFSNAGLGILKIDIADSQIRITLSPESIEVTVDEQDCELERGIIDGALELITGVPVATREMSCWTRGNGCCAFEASLDLSTGQRRYIAVAAPGANYAGAGPSSGLTGDSPGLNSWYMDLAARELSRARRHGKALAVLRIDIDDLGAVNAGHGRSAGDQLISAIAAAISKECRTEDHLWHSGEDEFVVLLPDTGEKAAVKVAQRLIDGISGSAGHLEQDLNASASIGMAIYPRHGDSLAALMSSAKSALYLAKSLGKGRAQLAKPGDAAGQAASNLARHPGRKRPAKEAEAASAVLAAAGGAEGGGQPRLKDDTNPAASGKGAAAVVDTPPAVAGEKTRPAVSVVLAVASPLLAAGIRNILAASSAMNIEIADETSTAEGARTAILDLRPDLVIADLAAVTANDFTIPKTLQEENLPCKLAVFASEADQEVLKLAAGYSPDGILLQSSTAEEIVAALDAIYLGKSIYPEEVRSALSELEDNRRLLEELSDREIDVLKLVAEGKSNSQISEELYITVNTVRFHLANIYQKLGVGNRTEAANYYHRQDLSPETQPKLL